MIFEIQHKNVNVNVEDVKKRVLEIWKNSGKNKKDVKSLRIYYIPEKLMAYFVINEGEMTGDISFS